MIAMKPVQSTLKKWMNENRNFKENYKKIRKEVLEDQEIKEFLILHPELTNQEISKNLIKLYEYKTQSKQCDKCQSLGGCINMLKGFSPILKTDNNEIHLQYEKCHNHVAYEKQKKQKELIQSLYMPKEILHASMTSIQIEDERIEAVDAIDEFLVKLNSSGLPSKGIYFYGPFGVGKTFFLGAVANELRKKDISSMIIYMPEFVREIKGSLKDDSLNAKVEYFKNAEVLMIDDIGAESQSAWFRDEILGSILQYRMMEGLPVFFTSNYSLNHLEDQLAKTNRGAVETVKAGRIIERIKQVSSEVRISGENRRNR